MNSRSRTRDWVDSQLGCRSLFWGGLRAEDGEALSDLPQAAGSFSIIGGRDVHKLRRVDFEDITGRRVDVDRWSIQDEPNAEAVREFRHQILRGLAAPSALLPYRPNEFLSSIAFARRDTCIELGMFAALQSVFEYKPWVETQVEQLTIPTIPWTYVPDEEKESTKTRVQSGPLMLRVTRSSGGVGMVRVESPEDIERDWPKQAEGLVSVAPYLSDTLPVNIGATVWRDGVSVSHLSVQIVGVPECTSRPFGYCGNDFGRARDIDSTLVRQIEEYTTKIGMWLRGHGYLGTFGVDYLLHAGRALFSEVNPRFQGSTHASCYLSCEAQESCLLLDHAAASLGMSCPQGPDLVSRVRNTPDLAHIVQHWAGEALAFDSRDPVPCLVGNDVIVDVTAKPGVTLENGAVIFRALLAGRLTADGYSLLPPWANRLRMNMLMLQHDSPPCENPRGMK